MTDRERPLADSLLQGGLQVEIGPFLARFRSDLPDVATHLERLYSDFPMRPSDEGHFDIALVTGRGWHRWFHRQANLVVDGVEPFLPLPERLGAPFVEWALNWCIGLHTNRWVVAHAAVLERGGRALVMPAPSGSGKSTLCAALAYSDWRLLSDEFAILDPVSALLQPAPRPVSLKNDSIDIIRRRHPDVVAGAEQIDLEGARLAHFRPPSHSVQQAHVPAAPGWVILPRYRAGEPWKLERVPKAEALIQLAGHSFNFSFVSTGYACLAELIRRSDCYRLEYSDLDDALDRLLRLTDN